ncbi:MAG: nucleotidyltransferase domain-containing protein [Deltaproteobacteria bacterium]
MSVRERWKGTRRIAFGTEKSIALILPILKADHRILHAYIFGSRASKRNDMSSDIDIAIYTTRDFSWQDYYLVHGKITQKLRSDRLDLAWLNMADPILCFEIIKNGKVLFYRDADKLNDFEWISKKKYYDYVIYLKRHKYQQEDAGIGL